MNLINTNIFQAVVTTAKDNAAQHPAWLRAIDKAAAELLHPFTYWAFADGVLTMQSPTSGKLYRIDDAHTCEATAHGRPCKHRAARRLMALYFAALATETTATPATPAPSTVAPAPVAPEIVAMRQRQAERDAAILVKYTPKGPTYNGIDI